MKRLHADLLLGLASLIWGFGFVAQKDASAHIGAFTFTACRFLLSALCVLPLVLRESGFRRLMPAIKATGTAKEVIALCIAMAFAVLLQQYGAAYTSVTNAAFLTGAYIVLVPFIGWMLYRTRVPRSLIFVGALSLAGIGLLTGVGLSNLLTGFNRGDFFMLLCAVSFGFQVTLLSRVAAALKMPITISFALYLTSGLLALGLALAFETIDFAVLRSAWLSIAYCGLLSGGVAYTLQAIAQQHAPAAASSIIMVSGEALVGAIGGAWLLHETMSASGYIGCGLILVSMILVEAIPFLRLQRQRRHTS